MLTRQLNLQVVRNLGAEVRLTPYHSLESLREAADGVIPQLGLHLSLAKQYVERRVGADSYGVVQRQDSLGVVLEECVYNGLLGGTLAKVQVCEQLRDVPANSNDLGEFAKPCKLSTKYEQ